MSANGGIRHLRLKVPIPAARPPAFLRQPTPPAAKGPRQESPPRQRMPGRRPRRRGVSGSNLSATGACVCRTSSATGSAAGRSSGTAPRSDPQEHGDASLPRLAIEPELGDSIATTSSGFIQSGQSTSPGAGDLPPHRVLGGLAFKIAHPAATRAGPGRPLGRGGLGLVRHKNQSSVRRSVATYLPPAVPAICAHRKGPAQRAFSVGAPRLELGTSSPFRGVEADGGECRELA
jgi:hypothetical protein